MDDLIIWEGWGWYAPIVRQSYEAGSWAEYRRCGLDGCFRYEAECEARRNGLGAVRFFASEEAFQKGGKKW